MKWKRQLGIFPWQHNQQLVLLASGKPYFDTLLASIAHAKSVIHFQVYIFEGDETGTLIKNALVQAAKRGVNIHIWLDAYGSLKFPKLWIAEFKSIGVTINFYSPLRIFSFYPIGSRLHQKIVVIDHSIGIVGGLNISNNYSHLGKEKTWFDYGLLVKGNSVKDLLAVCLSIEKGLVPLNTKEKDLTKYDLATGNYQARVLFNHWVKARLGISLVYRQRIRQARHEIILVASYFLPSPALKRLLKKAAKRGVKVKLILAGISDVGMVKLAAQYFYSDLLKSNIEIWEWQSSILHGKLAFFDGKYMGIGSYNLNRLSDFGSVECNVEIMNPSFIQQSQAEIVKQMQTHATKVLEKDYLQKKGWVQTILNFLAYRLVFLSLKLMHYFQNKPKR